jgi:hypothetical protein
MVEWLGFYGITSILNVGIRRGILRVIYRYVTHFFYSIIAGYPSLFYFEMEVKNIEAKKHSKRELMCMKG